MQACSIDRFHHITIKQTAVDAMRWILLSHVNRGNSRTLNVKSSTPIYQALGMTFVSRLMKHLYLRVEFFIKDGWMRWSHTMSKLV